MKRTFLLLLFLVVLTAATLVRADFLDARVGKSFTDTTGQGSSYPYSASDSKGPLGLCITGGWALKYGWTFRITQGAGNAYSSGTTSHSASLTGLGSGSDTLDADAEVAPGSPFSVWNAFASGTLLAPTSTTASDSVTASVTVTAFRCTAYFEAVTRIEYNPTTGCGGGSPPSPPPNPPSPPPTTYTLTVEAKVVNFTLPQGTTVSGSLQVSGSPVSGTLSFSGTSLQASRSATANSGTSYSETVPQSLLLALTASRTAISVSGYADAYSAVYYSSDYYTGKFNVSGSWSIAYQGGAVRVWLDACTQGGACRNLYYSGYIYGGGGSFTVRNVQLSGERLRLTIGYGYSTYVTASVTLSNSSTKTFYFAYWDTPSGKVYSSTVSGSLVSSLRLTATYSPSGGINTALVLLPGMDFLPHNTTHFIPLMPGVYTVETNATVILLDASTTRIYSVKGVNATVKVLSAFGEAAKVGTTRKSSRLPAATLPIVLIGNQSFYLFSLTAPETPNTTVYLKVNNSIYIYRVVAPRIEVTGIDYGWDAVRIHFSAYPSWENYNITALLDGKELSSATASAGVLEVRYEELQGVTNPRTIELAPSWGGRLEIPGEKPKLLLLPVAVELSFHNGSSGLVLTASEPQVLGVNATLRQALIAVNETPNMGDLCIRLVNAGKQAVWQVCVPYPYVAEVPYPDTSGHFLEVVYVPAPTRRVIIFPWWERL